MSFDQGLSGLNAASNNLDVVGNNIANASTYGFKEGVAQFADVYASSMASDVNQQIGLGVSMTSVKQQFAQGDLTTTSNPLDMAINGNGFFVLSDNGTTTYSRNGQFSLDKNGYLVTDTGANVTGYAASANGTISPATPTPLQIPTTDLSPATTSTASFSLNLNSGATVPTTTTFSPTDPTSYNSSTAMSIYDSQGNAHTLTTYYVRQGTGSPVTATNDWTVYSAVDGNLVTSGTPATPVTATLSFNSGGTMSSDVVDSLPITLTNGATINGGAALPLTFPAASTSQYGVAFSVSAMTQNGYTTGQLSGYSVSDDGVISGSYNNGQTRPLGQIALASFNNSQGLVSLGNNEWQSTSQSGAALVSTPGSGALGTLQSGALEDSNVDLTASLVDLITAQRDYQANAQTIKTESTIMQTLVSLS